MNPAHVNQSSTTDSSCLSCAIVLGERPTLGGTIVETGGFHAHQDIAYPIPGLVIVASKRHIKALDELTGDEAAEFMALVHAIRVQQRQVLGIEHVYYFYNEDTTHHFHLWMVPRYGWMSRFGRSVESLRPVLLHARDHMNSPEELAEVTRCAAALRDAMSRS
ncbi:MAG: diadenosine tetraphosphate hydrolase [Betaproteobacteria bacterium]|nr:diadenosine tetraphosphate hydrolase [Betaproteobacteria bacterium]